MPRLILIVVVIGYVALHGLGAWRRRLIEQARTVSVFVDDTRILHQARGAFDGVNMVALWNETNDDPGTVKAFDVMGQKVIRFPGGVPAEWYDWERPLDSGMTVLSPQRIWNMARSGGASLIFQTNAATFKTAMSGGKPYHLDNSGAHAAAWVKAAKAAGMQVAYWEIGNEPEMDAPDKAKGSDDSVYRWYNAKFAEQARAIKAAVPSARVMGPASANEWYWWHQENLAKFLAAEGNRHGTGLVDAVSIHWYPYQSEQAWTIARGDPEREWPRAMDAIEGMIGAADTRNLPVYVTEWNFEGGSADMGGTKLANALGAADCLGEFRETGVAGEEYFCLQHLDHGWGVLASKNDKWPLNYPSPTYFALKMGAMMLPREYSVSCDADRADEMSAYASGDGAGHRIVMLINKTDVVKTANIRFAAARGGTAKVYTLTGANGRINDSEPLYNGRPWVSWDTPLAPPRRQSASAPVRLAPFSMDIVEYGP